MTDSNKAMYCTDVNDFNKDNNDTRNSRFND